MPLAYESGTRLRARYHSTTDGTLSFIGWHDASLDLDCKFAVSSDGKLRCLPSRVASSTSYFRDASCTQRIATYGTSCTPPPAYASSSDGAACPARQRIFHLGAKLATASVYVKGPTNCVSVTVGGVDLYALGAEAAATSFAEAVEQVGPDIGGIARVDLATTDGARGFSRFLDTTRNTDCKFGLAADGMLRCHPGDAVVSGSYADASCTIPAALRPSSTCPAPTNASQLVAQGCGYASHVYGVGGSVSLYVKGTSCTPQAPDARYQFYAVGAEMPPSSFVAATVAIAGGSARVRAEALEVQGTKLPPSGRLHDTLRNEGCMFRTAADGEIRCLPRTDASAGQYFSDAGCTVPLVRRAKRAGCTTPPSTALRSDPTSCRTRAFAVGAPVTSNVYLLASTCVPVSPDGGDFYVLGAEIPAASFAQASVVEM